MPLKYKGKWEETLVPFHGALVPGCIEKTPYDNVYFIRVKAYRLENIIGQNGLYALTGRTYSGSNGAMIILCMYEGEPFRQEHKTNDFLYLPESRIFLGEMIQIPGILRESKNRLSSLIEALSMSYHYAVTGREHEYEFCTLSDNDTKDTLDKIALTMSKFGTMRDLEITNDKEKTEQHFFYNDEFDGWLMQFWFSPFHKNCSKPQRRSRQ